MSRFDLMGDGPGSAGLRCPARSKSSGQQCRRRSRGGGVCYIHGGRAPQVAARREARIVVAAARTMYAEDHAERDPGEVLLAAVRDVDAIVQKIKRQVERREELGPTDLLALGEWLDRAGKLAKTALDAGVQERQVRLEEQTARLVFEAIQGVLVDLGHNVAEARVQRVLATRLEPLRAIS